MRLASVNCPYNATPVDLTYLEVLVAIPIHTLANF